GEDQAATGEDQAATGEDQAATGEDQAATGEDQAATGEGQAATGEDQAATGEDQAATGEDQAATGEDQAATLMVRDTLRTVEVASRPADGAAHSLWVEALERDAAIREAGAVAPVRPDSASRLPALVAAQRVTLRTLQLQLDSLKAALPVEPAALAIVTDSAAPGLDAVAPVRPAPRWAVALLTETTTPWGVVPGPAAIRETLGGAHTRSLQLEHRLPNDRWLVRGGLSETRLTGRFRAVDETSGLRLSTDTLTSTGYDPAIRTDTIRIIHLDSTLQLNARVNADLQIVGYDSLWVPDNDTIYQVVVTHDSVQRTIQTVRTRLDTWRATREQQLRPTYRFWTIPVAAQFDVLRAGRWRAGVSIGAQLMLFRGGDAPVRLPDGTYTLRRVGPRGGPRGGPFRPVSVALTTGLDVRYRLTERLSVLAGAGARGWVQSPVRGEARPKVQPTAQLGLSWGLGGR
ncbi:MAG: hypothetical protein H7330_14790, partial [Hymenobacteraceae bacterium]|nr:hypothetical protein [Hymenobacteraceae bacterium]